MGAVLALVIAGAAAVSASSLAEGYIEAYFDMYPTRATAAGRHDHSSRLEDFSAERLRAWRQVNRDTLEQARATLAEPDLDPDLRLDLELLSRQAERELFGLEEMDRPSRSPFFWSGILSRATVFLLVREDLPREQRLRHAIARASAIPRLAAQARESLAGSPPSAIAPEFARIAARQVGAAAGFYRERFELAAGPDEGALREGLTAAGPAAAESLERLQVFLEELAGRATGSPRLGGLYERRFRLVTGVETPVEEVLRSAEADLVAKRAEVAEYGRSVWAGIFPDQEPPAEDKALVARLFARIGEDGAATVEEFVEDYRTLISSSIEFVREEGVITLPEPLTLVVSRSPSFLAGQSVGGVYPAGPYSEGDADTLLFLPTPPDSATPEQRAAFFRDFNHHFNVMITPHEVIPGHYLQLKYAARHPSKTRALFGDGVYIEGWGTFCERLMLDLGWGGPLDRLAHLKKQLENIARTIVDIRVHTQAASREEVLDFVRDEALQDEQFASNMWTRAITSSPQLTFYYLGYQQVTEAFEEARELAGDGFVLREFMDGMMEMGPVPVARYRERWRAQASSRLP